MKNNSYEDFNRVLNSALVGEERSKVKLVNMLDPLIKSSIKKYCPIKREYEDLYSDGRAMILFSIETFNHKSNFLHFVKLNLKYFYLDTYKYLLNVENDIRKSEVKNDNSEEGEITVFDTLDSGIDIEGDYIYREREGILRDAMNYLSPRQGLVVRLFYYERMSLSEIADFLGISVRTVVNLKSKAIENMKKFVGVYYD